MQDALELIRGKSRETRSRVLTVVGELDDPQLAWRPTPRAHSIGYTLWHIARSDDNVQLDLTGEALLWDRGSYAARSDHPASGVGAGWDDARAAALALPPKQAVCLTHENRHLGEIEYIKGLQGLRGTATV